MKKARETNRKIEEFKGWKIKKLKIFKLNTQKIAKIQVKKVAGVLFSWFLLYRGHQKQKQQFSSVICWVHFKGEGSCVKIIFDQFLHIAEVMKCRENIKVCIVIISKHRTLLPPTCMLSRYLSLNNSQFTKSTS